MHFDQHFDTKFASIGRDFPYTIKCLWKHKTAGSRFFDSIADGIEAHHCHAVIGQCREYPLQVTFPKWMTHIDIQLMLCESRPERHAFTVLQRYVDERFSGPRTIDGSQVIGSHSAREDRLASQKHPTKSRCRPMPEIVQELARAIRDMIDDDVRHHTYLPRQFLDVPPIPQARIHLCMVDGVEPGVRTVDWIEKRQ